MGMTVVKIEMGVTVVNIKMKRVVIAMFVLGDP